MMSKEALLADFKASCADLKTVSETETNEGDSLSRLVQAKSLAKAGAEAVNGKPIYENPSSADGVLSDGTTKLKEIVQRNKLDDNEMKARGVSNGNDNSLSEQSSDENVQLFSGGEESVSEQEDDKKDADANDEEKNIDRY